MVLKCPFKFLNILILFFLIFFKVPLPEQVDAHQNVYPPGTQGAQNLHALNRVHIRMNVGNLQPHPLDVYKRQRMS